MKRSNKGLTLIELIVTVAIASMIVVSAMSFLVAVTRVYARSKQEVDLQNEVQPEEEDGETVVENYMLVSGTVRAFRYFFMTYDFYKNEIFDDKLPFCQIFTTSTTTST